MNGPHARYNVSASGNGLAARLAVPDSSSVTLDGDLSAEGACVAGVLRDFDLLDLLSERCTVTGGVDTLARVFFACTPSSFLLRCSPHVQPQASMAAQQAFSFSAAAAISSGRPPSRGLGVVGAYRVPYLPVIPTFFVRFVILSDVCG